MRKIKYISLFILILLMLFTTSCKRDNSLKTSVREIDKYGHVILKISRSEFEKNGYALGDIVQININGKTYQMPYFNGYYVDEGEYLLYASNTKDQISASINFGQFYLDANAQAGDEVKMSMYEKAGA